MEVGLEVVLSPKSDTHLNSVNLSNCRRRGLYIYTYFPTRRSHMLHNYTFYFFIDEPSQS